MHYFDHRLASNLVQRRLDQRQQTRASAVAVYALKARIGEWLADKRRHLAGQAARPASDTPQPA